VLGSVDLPVGDSACTLPVSVQIANARHHLAGLLGEGFEIRVVDLYSLEGVDRDVALDAVVAGEPSPFVLANGRLVCSGAVDGAAIAKALMQGTARCSEV